MEPLYRISHWAPEKSGTTLHSVRNCMMLSTSARVTAESSSHARCRFFLPTFICSSALFDGYKGGGALFPGYQTMVKGTTAGKDDSSEESKIVTSQVRLWANNLP